MSWHTVPAAPAFAVHGDHVQRWTALHGVSAASPLLAPEFVAAALAVFGTGRELLVWHTNDGAVDTMAIVTPTRFGVWETFQPAQAPVGLWLQRDSNAPVALLAGLLRALPGPALMLGLTQCDPMLIARAPDSATMRSTDYIQTARISIDSDFDSYWNARGKNLRANLKKQRARLRQDGVSTRLAISRAPHDMAQAVADWKRAAGRPPAALRSAPAMHRAAFTVRCSKGLPPSAAPVSTAITWASNLPRWIYAWKVAAAWSCSRPPTTRHWDVSSRRRC